MAAIKMTHSLGSVFIVVGMVALFISQILIGAHAFSKNPIGGILCFVVPFYLLAYAKKYSVGRALMRVWYVGLVALVVGVFLSS